MGIGDDIKHGAEKLGGKAKEEWGDLTDNERLEAEGKAQQVEADVKNAAADVGDTVERTVDDVRDEFRR
ncbi:MAG: CsbD family protein [Actinomycetales bacterium]|nr:CsbD family protein [Actinomycetales bacterium]